MTDVDELEQKIKEGEALIQQERFSGWIPLIVSIGIAFGMGIKIPSSAVYLLITFLALLYMGFNIWRIVNAQINIKKLEKKVQEYREKKSKLEHPNL